MQHSVLKLTVHTLSTFFNCQEVVTRKTLFRRPLFIEHFYLYFGVHSPSVGLDLHFILHCVLLMWTAMGLHDTKSNVMEIRNSNLKYVKELVSSAIYLQNGSSGPCCYYVVGSKSFWPDIQKPRQMENAVRDV